MERRKDLITIALLFVAISISISWYGNLGATHEINETREVPIPFLESKNLHIKNWKGRQVTYFYYSEVYLEKKRSAIPFVWTETILDQSKPKIVHRPKSNCDCEDENLTNKNNSNE